MSDVDLLIPTTEHAPFDLVAYADGTFHRGQVKYRSGRRGSVVVELRSGWTDLRGVHKLPMDEDKRRASA